MNKIYVKKKGRWGLVNKNSLEDLIFEIINNRFNEIPKLPTDNLKEDNVLLLNTNNNPEWNILPEIESSNPQVGDIIYMISMNNKVPDNCLFCDGSYISEKDYPILFSKLDSNTSNSEGQRKLPLITMTDGSVACIIANPISLCLTEKQVRNVINDEMSYQR